jgi:hypothetical protein
LTANLPGSELIVSFDSRYIEQFLIAIAMTSLTVLTHYRAMNWIHSYFSQFRAGTKSHRSRRLVMIGIAGIMMATHFVEVLIWALFFFLRGVIPSFIAAVYFSIGCYTTLGESGITLPPHWRGLGGFESMNAMLMYGWSTAILAAVVMQIQNLDD